MTDLTLDKSLAMLSAYATYALAMTRSTPTTGIAIEPKVETKTETRETKAEPVVFHVKKRFNGPSMNSSYFEYIKKEVVFQYHKIFKREVAQFSRDDISAYKKQLPILSQFVEAIEQDYGVNVRSVFVNHYRDGNDQASYHKDSYGGTGVFTISLGGSRDFLTKDDKTGAVTEYRLDDGDLFFFNMIFNAVNKHSVPVRKRMNDPRISIVLFT